MATTTSKEVEVPLWVISKFFALRILTYQLANTSEHGNGEL